MGDNLSKIMRHPWQYWYADGLPELAIGSIFLVVGLLFSGQAAVPAGSPWKGLASLAFPILLVGGMLLTRRLVAAAKSRLTYPRTGYVAYPHPSRLRRIVTLLLGAGVAGLAVVLLSGAKSDALDLIFQGLFVGLLMALVGQGLVRFYVVGAFAAILGIALAAIAMPEEPGTGIFYGLLGVALIISGGVTLVRYLRQNPLSEEESHGQ